MGEETRRRPRSEIRGPLLTPATALLDGDRLAALRRYEVLDSPPEAPFDRVMRLAVRVFDVPVAAVSLVDESRVWFKARHGLDVDELPREPGLCATGILRDDPLVLPDTTVDPTASAHPLVTGEAGIRFYAGAPLRTHDGFHLGMVCVADRRARNVSADEIALLDDLASVVVDQLELRLLRRAAPSPTGHGVEWREPPAPKSRNLDQWRPLLEIVARRPGVWGKLAHYDGETSAYRAAGQLRSRTDLPAGDWDFVARRAASGSDLFGRVRSG